MKETSLFPSLLLCWLLFLSPTEAFCPSNGPKSSLFSPSFRSNVADRQSTSHLFQSTSEDSDAPKKRRKRVKRKETAEEQDETPPASTPTPDRKPRDDGPVQLQVKDVRDLVGGGAPQTTTASSTSRETPSTKFAAKTTNPVSTPLSQGGGLSDDSLKMLLEDAKEFQSLEPSSAVADGSEETDLSIPDTFRNILSTIVTIDFFVVCAFLVWFLAGIFCSYILKDDTVQIAFNRTYWTVLYCERVVCECCFLIFVFLCTLSFVLAELFQPVVQPALGILMIGAIAGSFGTKDEEEAL
jgi:hypothetical protein